MELSKVLFSEIRNLVLSFLIAHQGFEIDTILFKFIGVDILKETEQHQCALLEFIPSNPPGAFRLRGVASNLYLAMDKKGILYGEENYEDDHTLFVEHADVSF